MTKPHSNPKFTDGQLELYRERAITEYGERERNDMLDLLDQIAALKDEINGLRETHNHITERVVGEYVLLFPQNAFDGGVLGYHLGQVFDALKTEIKVDEQLLASTEEILAKTIAELEVTDKLEKDHRRVVLAIPECPAHGECVPHALEWIEESKRIRGKFENAETLIAELWCQANENDGSTQCGYCYAHVDLENGTTICNHDPRCLVSLFIK